MLGRGNRFFAPTSPLDVKRYRRAARLFAQEKSRLPIPHELIPSQGRSDQRPLLYGYKRYKEMFNDRQLLCLGRIAAAIRRTKDPAVRRALALAFSHSLATNNMFCSYAFGYRRLCPIFSVHAYRKVPRPVEGNVWGLHTGRGSFRNAVRALLAGSEYMRDPFEYRYNRSNRPQRVSVKPEPDGTAPPARRTVRIYNRSSEHLNPIPTGSIDLILTDPPYYDNLSYSELSDFYHVWLRKLLKHDYVGAHQKHTPMARALYGGRRRGSDEDPVAQFTTRLSSVFSECYRVTKRDGALIFTFHHRDPAAWEALGRAVLGAGFRIDEVCPVRSEGRSGLHNYEGSIKWDAVFACRKRSTATRAVPTPHATMAAAAAAICEAKSLATHIRRSRLSFADADRSSFTMALTLKEYSQRGFAPESLGSALEIVCPGFRKPTEARSSGNEGPDGR
jgi:adenine-specific DNA methylase